MTTLRIDIDRGNSRVITLVGEIDAEKARWAIEVSSSFLPTDTRLRHLVKYKTVVLAQWYRRSLIHQGLRVRDSLRALFYETFLEEVRFSAGNLNQGHSPER